MRPRGAPSAPPPIARPAPPRGRAGRAGRARPVPARLAGGRAAGPPRWRTDRGRATVPWSRPRSSAWPRSSTSWPGCRSRPRSSSGTSCRPAIPGYQPRLLDELGALGEVAWVGRGSLGRDDGRIALFRPGREALRAAGSGPASVEMAAADRPDGPRHEAIRAFLARRGASFYRELHAAAGGGPDREMLDALWDLVWAGELTNDTFAPLRALRWARPGREARRRPGRLTSPRTTRGGRPLVAGRATLPDRSGIQRRPRRCDPAGADPDRASPRPRPGAARAARRADPRGRGVARACSAGSARSTRSSGRSRRPVGSGAATSSTGSARPSSRCPGRSTGCGRSARPAEIRSRARVHAAGGRRPGQPLRRRAGLAAPRRRRSARRSLGPPGRTSCSSTGWPPCSSSAVAVRSPCCRPPTIRSVAGLALRALGAPRRRRPVPRAARRPRRRPPGRRVARGVRRFSRPGSCRAIAASRSRATLSHDARRRHAPPDRRRAPTIPRRADR